MLRNKIEILIHVLFWIFMLLSINVQWTENWFDVSLRPKSPAPLSVIMFAVYFYGNAFVLIPNYFSKSTWKKYLIGAFMLFILPEILRILFYKLFISSDGIEAMLFSRDSLLFGAPSAFFIALNTSFIYRLMMDWFMNKDKIESLESAASKKKVIVPYEDVNLLSKEESVGLKRDILEQLEQKELFLNSELTLRELSESVHSTEKKVSYLINQNLKSNFYELINKYRIEKFKSEAAKPENKSLSIVGLALNCGFSSKSSFYRAFKSHMDMSPSAFMKKIKDSQ